MRKVIIFGNFGYLFEKNGLCLKRTYYGQVKLVYVAGQGMEEIKHFRKGLGTWENSLLVSILLLIFILNLR